MSVTDDNTSTFARGLLRGTAFFAILLIIDVFWNTVVAPSETVLTVGNVITAGFAASIFVVVMHYLDQKSANKG